MKTFLSLLLITVTSLSPVVVCGQTASAQDQEDVIRVRSNEVRLDIVVKDKKGRPIRDLKASDFEVLEDGAPQKVESFTFIAREGATAPSDPKDSKNPAGPTPPSVPGKRSTPAVTALVFDRLSPEARALARRAGLAYAQEGMANGGFTGVFGIDLALRTVQNFTDDPQLIKEAVEHVTGTTVSTYNSGLAKARDNIERSAALDNQITNSVSTASAAGAARDSAGASEAGAAAGQAAAQQKLLEMQNQMLDHYERLERDQQGFATINSLLAVIIPMANLPGRKTIIFFSEGLKLPPNVLQKFPSVINAANRANVSIYAIDAAGLRTDNPTLEAANELKSIAAQSIATQGRGNDRMASGPYLRGLERNEDVLRFDPRSGLGTLSDLTGGFLIHDTNDLASGMRRIDDDMNGYYYLTYVPQNKEYDGRFRRITVKVARPNVEVQSRQGYYAVESVGQLPLLEYEAPAIAAARTWRPGPKENTLHSTAISYPVPDKDGLTLIVAEVPAAGADFSILALVRDETEQIVQKLSQHYSFTDQPADQAKKGSVLFYRETQLSPGKYHVQVIAYDAATREVNVSTTALEIVASDQTKPRLSSVAVLKTAERLTADEQKRNQPFQFGELLLYPNLGEKIDRQRTKELAYFFTAWPAKGSTKPMQVTLEIFQNNRAVGKTSGQLPAPDANGQVKYASSFSLEKFPAGVFELKVTVGDGQNSVSRSTTFYVGS